VRCSASRGGFWKTFSPRFGKLASLMLSQLRAAATLYAMAILSGHPWPEFKDGENEAYICFILYFYYILFHW
jgi:hypothetical protein